MLWWRGYSYRLATCDALNMRTLYQQAVIEKVDAMADAQFEEHCAALLRPVATGTWRTSRSHSLGGRVTSGRAR